MTFFIGLCVGTVIGLCLSAWLRGTDGYGDDDGV
jgi:hypothetical protein